MGWEGRALVRSTQLPTRVQISRIFDRPSTILCSRRGRHGYHVRSKSLNVGGFVPHDVVHGDWPTDWLYVFTPELD